MNDNSIVLLSGGLDSLVTLAIAVMKKKNIFALHTSYGQITQKKELEAFNNITNYYDIKNKLIVDIDYLKQIGGTKLIDKNFDNKNTNEQIPNTYVPFRNANLLAIATS
jgi:7-cyano-7-deazaguanine synthase